MPNKRDAALTPVLWQLLRRAEYSKKQDIRNKHKVPESQTCSGSRPKQIRVNMNPPMRFFVIPNAYQKKKGTTKFNLLGVGELPVFRVIDSVLIQD